MRLVLDTNVILSALLWRGTPHRLPTLILNRPDIRICTSPALIDELADVLSRAKLAQQLAAVGTTAAQLVADFIEVIDLVEPAEVPRVITRDIDDDQVLAAAVEARADLIISGDTQDLLPLQRYRGIEIVNAAEALRRLTGQGA